MANGRVIEPVQEIMKPFEPCNLLLLTLCLEGFFIYRTLINSGEEILESLFELWLEVHCEFFHQLRILPLRRVAADSTEAKSVSEPCLVLSDTEQIKEIV